MKNSNWARAMCAAGMLSMFCNMGLCSNILAVYLPFIETDGVTGSQGSAIISVRCISSFLATFVVSKFYEKVSLRSGLALATVLAAAGYGIFAVGGSIFVYYIGAVVLGIAYGFGTIIPVSVLITQWFRKGKGTALGLCSMGTGIATIIFAPLITVNTLARGLRSTCLIMGAFIFACGIIIYLIVRDRPEDVGVLPYGSESETVEEIREETVRSFHIPRSVWLSMMLMLFLVGGAGQSCSSHISIAVTTAGYSAAQAGIATSVYGATIILGKLLMGRVADRIGAMKASLIFMGVFAFGCLMPLFMNGTSIPVIYAFGGILGLGCPFFTIGVSLWASDLADKENYEMTLRWYQILYSAGGIIFTSIPGMLADVTHSYISAYLMLLVMIVVSMIMLIYFYQRRKTIYK